jgi:hypothetical protein
MGSRILSSSSLLGQQTLLVDAQGNGDYTTIQEALNVAALYATITSRWSVRVAPGLYTEQITLKNYVDLLGLGPGRATRLKRSSGALIAAPASCVVADLWLETVDTPVVTLSSGFTGTLELDNIIIDQTPLDIAPIQVAGGTININRSNISSGGYFDLSGGVLNAHHSVIRNQAASDGGQNMALYIQGGSLLLTHSLVENVSPAGYCVVIDGAVTSLKALHSTFRKSTSTEAIYVSGSTMRTFIFGKCCGNGSIDAHCDGYHDYDSDATI